MEIPAIVVIAYNRPKSLARLLYSLSKAEYVDKNVKLIISIDKGENADVLAIANEFHWQFGDKLVIYQSENLKLKNHILKSGGLSQQYGSIIMLEDDLYVSPYFYKYTIKALEFSKGKEYIAGISLYNHQFNVHVQENFGPIEDGYDNWYLQFASSWGQVWTDKQWAGFASWYGKNSNRNLEDINMPINVSNWPESSWLKYFIKYTIEVNKYFIYPKISLTTNFTDAGTHNSNDSTVYQVPIQMFDKINYNFSDLNKSNAVYNAFFENENMHKYLDLEKEDICVDLYGYRQDISKKYYLSSRKCDYKIIKTFGCSLRPHEVNVIENIGGNDLFLYDTSINEINKRRLNDIRRMEYYLKTVTDEKFCAILKMKIFERIKVNNYRFKKIIKLIRNHTLLDLLNTRLRHRKE